MCWSRTIALVGGLAAALAGGLARGQEPFQPGVAKPEFVQKEDDKKEPKIDEKKTDQPPVIDFAQAPQPRAETRPGLKRHIIGDQQGYFTTIRVPVDGTAFINFDGQPIILPFKGRRDVRIPIPGRGGFKVGENESVMPGDRVFFTYNYYSDIHSPADGADRTLTFDRDFSDVFGFPITGTVTLPGIAPPRFDLHRETVGLEKSFFDGRFSLGMRVPMFQQVGPIDAQDLGDMTFIIKVAPWGGDPLRDTGTCFGLAVTAPTGSDIPLPGGSIHPTILQPFVGYSLGERFFLHGFTSVAAPTDERDVTFLFNDVGLGYWLFRDGDGLITGVAPTVEAHVTTPLNHRRDSDLIQGLDLLVMTGGAHIGLGDRSLLTLGVAVPVTGPRPFNVEAIVQLNLRF